jgi:hypothetical protein
MQERIWDASKAGDKVLLQQYLVEASPEDLLLEKKDDVRHCVECRHSSLSVLCTAVIFDCFDFRVWNLTCVSARIGSDVHGARDSSM